MNESEVWNSFRKGSDAAFASIYRQHVKVLFAYGIKIVKDRAVVEDCIHDLFIELWDRKVFLSSTDSIKLYLFKGLKRKILKVIEKNNRYCAKEELTEEYNFTIEFSHEATLIEHQLTLEQEARLKQAIDKLSKHQREIIFLRFYAALSYEEIASLMCINYQSVKNLVFRSMKTLRSEFDTSLIPLYLLLSCLSLDNFNFFL
jgi:RNA polymerase sigma factor (sigma-70 family)